MSGHDDLVELFDYVWERFRDRMAGLTDEELSWQPTDDSRISLRWRLEHIAGFLHEDRNAPWLGVLTSWERQPEPGGTGVGGSARAALASVEQAYALWRDLLRATTDESLAEPVGHAAGAHADASRRSFAFHIVDELIHHTAEAALLRDLYARRR